MPSLSAHYLFADSVVGIEGKGPLREAICLGTQGPDPFFYYSGNPFAKKPHAKEVQNYGNVLHSDSIASTYGAMRNLLENSPEKGLLLAYVKGLLMHYSLDSTAHPYIFYRSGFDEAGELTGYYSWSHKAFEALLDAVLLEKYPSLPRSPKDVLVAGKDVSKKISHLWKQVGPDYFAEDTFALAIHDFHSIEKLLQSKSGWKRPFWRMLGKESAMYGLSYPVHLKKYESIDVLNEKHDVWYDPVSGEEHHESFLDLMEIAKARYLKGEKILEKGSDVVDELASWEKGINHNGAPFLKKMVHQDVCWKKK